MKIEDDKVVLELHSEYGKNLPRQPDVVLAFELLKAMKAMRGNPLAKEVNDLNLALSKITGEWQVGVRPVGSDQIHRCFVCGGQNEGTSQFMSNICLISTPEEAEHVQALLPGSRIAFYHGDPKVPQVKVGACKKHRPNLDALYLGAHGAGHVSKWLVSMAQNVQEG